MEGLRGTKTWAVICYQVGIKLRDIWSNPKQGHERHSGQIR